MLRVAVVGFGAIGRELARRLEGDPHATVTQVVTTPRSLLQARADALALAGPPIVAERLDLRAAQRPDLVVECAGHGAIDAHVIGALEAGVPCVLASVGALADDGCAARIEAAARHGNTHVTLATGAIGAIDALEAARFGGLDAVGYTGRKPPAAWIGTPAGSAAELAALDRPTAIFTGSAREAARLYPKNANVAATVALAGLGLDRTEVQLIADPHAAGNMHRVEAYGTFGRLDVQLENLALPDNPKTSALTVYSLLRAVRARATPLSF